MASNIHPKPVIPRENKHVRYIMQSEHFPGLNPGRQLDVYYYSTHSEAIPLPWKQREGTCGQKNKLSLRS